MHPSEIKKGSWYIVAGQGALLCNEDPKLGRLVASVDRRGFRVAAIPPEKLVIGFTTAHYYQAEFGGPPPSNYWAAAEHVIRVVDRAFLETFILQATARFGESDLGVENAKLGLAWAIAAEQPPRPGGSK